MFTAEFNNELFIITDCFGTDNIRISTSVYKFITRKDRNQFIEKYKKKYLHLDYSPFNIKFDDESKKYFAGI